MGAVEIPVLVVGAGPVGMMASILLAGLGIDSLIVERRDGPHRAPQAHVVNPRTLEICRAAGIDVERLRRSATPRQDGSEVAWVTTLAGREFGRLPYERQGDENLLHTPTPLLNLSQHRFEPILLEHLLKQSGAEVHYRHRWEALSQDTDAVTSTIVDLDADRRYQIRSRYLLAADGAGSRVRASLGIDMVGPAELQSFVMIHFEADLRALVRERPAILYWTTDPSCPGTLVAHDIDGTWVFMHPWNRVVEAADTYTHARCAELVARAIGRDDVEFVIRDVSTWTMTAQVAERYGSGRVFLVGDSAHRFPPSGGMGMNTGIQDAHNLAWKLDAVEQGWAPPALLETYEAERRPVAQENADQSLHNAVKLLEVFAALGLSEDLVASRANMERLWVEPERLARVQAAIADQREHFDMFGLQLGFSYEAGAIVADGSAKPRVASPVSDFVASSRPGSRLPHAWIERAGARVSTLDLIATHGFTLIAGPEGAAWARAAAKITAAPLRPLVEGRDFADPEHNWAAVRGIDAGGALLVRPDQHVAWRARTGAADPGAALAAALAVSTGRTAENG